MDILKARYRSRDEFFAAYRSDSPRGALFVATTRAHRAGEEVLIELVCDGLPNRILVRGRVLEWHPALPRLRVRAGATVEFAAEEEEKRRFILSAVKGEFVPPKRKHTRIPVEVPVRVSLPRSTDSAEGLITEISVGGALLQCSIAPAKGSELVVEILPPGGEAPMSVTGKVAYHTKLGTGLKFVYRDGGGSRRIRELIRRIRVQ
jgi:Tfp pilus assembly protein PilZ